MRIIPFDELRNISKEDVVYSARCVKNFLRQHPKVSFACIYGGVANDHFDKYSDIDVFVLYSDFSIIEEIKFAYETNKFGKAEIEWQLIPQQLTLFTGIAKEENYLRTVQNNHVLITGSRDEFLEMGINKGDLENFLLKKITKISDYYIKNDIDADTLSGMLRAIEHVPRKMTNYTGSSKTECKNLYTKFLNSLDESLLTAWKKVYLLPSDYKRSMRRITEQSSYDDAVQKIHSQVLSYLLWLFENYKIANQKSLKL